MPNIGSNITSRLIITLPFSYRHGVPFDISLHSGLIGLIKPIGANALETYTGVRQSLSHFPYTAPLKTIF